ncbi:hypothetical protein RUM43_014294 [Polyplax serrata]|uniref:Uncharacterized protein n=1 Tax=Polyplax serrata TaxID=468196 RepID=A0AAN8PH44_POLSC
MAVANKTQPTKYLTVYKKDYYAKKCPREPLIRPIQDYANPVAGALEEYVLPYCKYNELPPTLKANYPEPKEYALEVAEKYPTTRELLRDSPDGSPDFEVIDKLYENENRTTYMMSYCRLRDYDSKTKRDRTTGTLPEGWVVPLTTQKCSYRNPFVLSPEGLEKIVVKRPKDNLIPNKKEREILEVKTGETIYISDISNTGMEIIKGKLHGDVNIRPQFDQDELLRAKLIRNN